MHRADDQFVSAFLERSDREKVTLEQFVAPFEHSSEFVRNDLGMTLVDVIEDEMSRGDNTDQIAATIHR